LEISGHIRDTPVSHHHRQDRRRQIISTENCSLSKVTLSHREKGLHAALKPCKDYKLTIILAVGFLASSKAAIDGLRASTRSRFTCRHTSPNQRLPFLVHKGAPNVSQGNMIVFGMKWRSTAKSANSCAMNVVGSSRQRKLWAITNAQWLKEEQDGLCHNDGNHSCSLCLHAKGSQIS
jgi:hypothetical protein